MTKTNTKLTDTNSNAHRRSPFYRRAWFLALVIILLIALIVFLIVFLVRPDRQPGLSTGESSNSESSSDSSQPDANDHTQDGQHENLDEPYSDPDQITTQYEGDNPNTSNELSGSVTYTDYNGNTLSIGTMIDQYLSEGTCELKLTGNSGATYTATSTILAAASTAACNDFSIDVIPDYYQIEIKLTANGKHGIINDGVQL